MSTAESLTGGQLAARLTAVPGASTAYRGGVVAYATELKVAVLGVPASLVAQHGVVSAECALAMAVGIRELTGSTYGVSTTGVAGPGRQEDKPVGTVYVGLCGPSAAAAVTLELAELAELGELGELAGNRAAIIDRTVEAALQALLDQLTTTLSG